MNKFFKGLLLFCMLLVCTNLKAQTRSANNAFNASSVTECPHLLMEMSDGEIIYTLITQDLKLSHESDYVFNIITEKKQTSVDLSDIISLGILYMEPQPEPDPDPDEGGSTIVEALKAGDQPWSIMTVDGKVISQDKAGRPDLSSLPSGNVYIIKIGNRSYKYLNLK